MIAFVDIDNQKVLLYYEKGLREIPFNKISSLKKITGNNKIYYVTNVVETGAKDIMDLISEITGEEIKEVEERIEEKKYIHSTISGVLLVPEKDFRLRGKYDIKLIDEDILDIMKTPSFKNLLNSGKIEKITATERKKLLAEKKATEDEKRRKIEARENKERSRADQYLKDGEFDDDDELNLGGHADIIPVDINGSSGGGGVTLNEGGGSMEELMSQLNEDK